MYFNTSTDSLRIEQAAMLMGMLKNPSLYNPVRRGDTTTHRRMIVLYQMKKNEMISSAQYDSLRALPLGLDFTKVDHKNLNQGENFVQNLPGNSKTSSKFEKNVDVFRDRNGSYKYQTKRFLAET